MRIAFLATKLTEYDAISNYSIAMLAKLSVDNSVDLYSFRNETRIPLGINQCFYSPLHEHNLRSVLTSFMNMRRLAHKLSKYDILIICGPEIAILPSIHLAKYFNNNVKLVWDYHGLTPPQYLHIKNRIFTYIRHAVFIESMKNADSILVRSEYIKKELQSHIGRQKIKITPFGIESGQFKKVNSGEIENKYNLDKKFVLLYVGRLVSHKKVDVLIRSIPILDDDTVLIIVGDGEEKAKLQQLASSLDVDKRIIFTGKVTDEQLSEYYAISDVFVTASLHEGFCVPIIESFVNCNPVIVPNRTAMPEVAGECGLVYDGSISDFVDKVNKLKKDEEMRKSLKSVCLERWEKFNLEKTSIIYVNMINQMNNTRCCNKIDIRKQFLVKRYAKGNILNVGCGRLHLDNAVNLDMNKDLKPDIIGDFHHLPFKDKQFDCVFAFDIIEHTTTPENMLNEVERVGKNAVIECLDFDFCKKNWEDDSTHVTYFNKDIYEKVLRPRGYKCFSFGNEMIVAVKEPLILDKELCFFYRLYNKFSLLGR